ncbi:hypothetical protein NPS53_09585 [Pseudomonas putida]|uniref:hypothetical protein n=1 Tax=Pseudomonas putida TaxID=303 RepID=UPI002363CEE1|nr:hypothetical protein [Pseudomonas putida]MDD2139829.1 hypothetical protein [Pseudomonas putida]HDS1721752.1 hypothetical protein [Pseudomonas putida]
MLYHVTPLANLPSIFSNGLVPQIGERSALHGESSENLYLFTSAEACETALMNWLGDEFEDVELAVLEFEDGDIAGDTSSGYELVCHTSIPASCIKRVLDENLEPTDTPSADLVEVQHERI